MDKKVIFYDGGCADCQNVAAYFSRNGVDHERKNIKAHPELANEAKAKGAKTFPAVFVDSQLIEGWNEQKLSSVLESSK